MAREQRAQAQQETPVYHEQRMTLIRPRLTDFHGVSAAQADLDFAIPFLDEDIPLYVDPFLLWKSPSQQDQALHTSVVNSFNHLNYLLRKSRESEARDTLIRISECSEVGLGQSKKRRGSRIGSAKAEEILSLFRAIHHYGQHGFTHFEEIQLYVSNVSKDRVSDICCSFLKSWLIDYTTQVCYELKIPMQKVSVPEVYDYREHRLESREAVLPLSAEGTPLLVVPKRWLRFCPWISFDDYFKKHCPQDDVFGPEEPRQPAKVLTYNRAHYEVVRDYVAAKERTQEDCKTDPLFKQIPVTSAKSKLSTILALPTGKTDNADRKYEDHVCQLLASLLYPQLDFATEQSRTDSNVLIRDLIFYNNRSIDFLDEIQQAYGNRQIVFELKNVKEVGRDHLNQLNRYLTSELGHFGVLVTRNPLKRAMLKNTIDLWAGQRKCIIVLTDEDLRLMVTVFESKQRSPIEVLKKKYVEFRRACPS